MKSPDKDILHGIYKKDIKTFELLYNQYFNRLCHYAYSYIDERKQAEDIVHDVFVALWNKKLEADTIECISSYLFRAAHHKCVSYLRHKIVQRKYEARHSLKIKEAELMYHDYKNYTFSSLQLQEMQDIIDTTINDLPGKTADIFKLSRKEELKNTEIATKLNVSVKTVEYHMTKALQALQQALKEFI
ncbi:MAG: RNA polymerase sigma-70 factor [Bacteroidales bacterium]|nr:RNA polymerase sigma-70 factor [Bacteroidales bacterium]